MKKSEFDKIMKMLADINREVDELAIEIENLKDNSSSKSVKKLSKEDKQKRKQEKESRIYQFKKIYEEDKQTFVDMVCDKEQFARFKCIEFDGGYMWKVKNKPKSILFRVGMLQYCYYLSDQQALFTVWLMLCRLNLRIHGYLLNKRLIFFIIR